MDVGQSSEAHPSGDGDGGETVEIKIKTLDAQSYTLRVDKNTPVPALKDQIASVVGVPVENQRLICRGKVLKDDQLLAAYNVEDGHTLHLVARQPPQPSPPSSSPGQEQQSGPLGSSEMVIVSPRNRPGHVSHSLLMGTINIPDGGEGGMPDLNRIISAVLNSVGIGNAMPGGMGGGSAGQVAVGVVPSQAQQTTGSDGLPTSEGTEPRPQAGSPSAEQAGLPREVEARVHIDALYGVPHTGVFTGPGGTTPTNPFRTVHQPAVVPDALTTMSQYLDRLEQSFSIIDGRGQNVEGPPASEGAVRMEGSSMSGVTSESGLGRAGSITRPSLSSGPSVPSSNTANNDRQGVAVPAGPPAPPRRLPTPSALGAIIHRVQNLLSGQAGTALSRLAAQLENEPNLLDIGVRDEMQMIALRDGNMMQQLGALLLELGRTTLTLRLGQTPAESVVNAGPAVFISPSGPNPMMVQSLPLQTGVALGALPSGTSQTNVGAVGPTIGPRSINIHIHTSDMRLPSPSPSPSPSPQQPPRAVIGVTSGAPSITVRQIVERPEGMNPDHALTVRQIIERAEAASGVQEGNSEPNSQPSSGGALQGAIMTFNENGSMRVVPVRTRTAAGSLASHPQTGTDGGAASVFQPLIARFQQQLGSVQQPGSPVSTTPSAAAEDSSNAVPGASAGGQTSQTGSEASAQVQVQVQNQTWSSPAASGPPSVNGVLVGANDIQRDASMQAENRRGGEGVHSEQRVDGLVQGVDVDQIVDSLGPFLNQLAAAFQQARPQPHYQLTPEQLNQPNSASQPNLPAVPATGGGSAASFGSLGVSSEQPGQERGEAPEASCVKQSQPVSQVKLDDKMDVGNLNENHGDPGSSSTTSLSVNEKPVEVKHHEEGGSVEGQVGNEDRPPTPIGLGLGGLQPVSARPRRRSHAQPRQVQSADVGAPAAAGNGPHPQRGGSQNLLQSLVSQIDRPSNRPEGNAMEQSLGQLTQGLLPLLGRVGNRGTTQGGDELGDMMGQLITRTVDGRNPGQGAFPAEMLRGVMGQLVQSPLMENLVQQVMTGVNNEETGDVERAFAGLGNRSQGGQGGFDFAGIVQQMLPVVSQMLGGRSTSSAGQQVASSANERNQNAEGAARDSPGQTNDSGRWREALSEEEATAWSETISADVEQQQMMEPQRPFSDVYVRGSPVAKRQKTDLEGAAQKLENGRSHEEAPKTVADNAAGQVGGFNGSNSEGDPVSGCVTGSDGASDA